MKVDGSRVEAGFSVAEVLAAVAMFLIVAGGLAASTVAAIKANSISRDLSVATTLVQEKIEFFRALDPSIPAQRALLASGSDTVDDTAAVGTRYRRAWTVAQDVPKYGMVSVTVRIEWNGPERRAVEAATYLCRLPACA